MYDFNHSYNSNAHILIESINYVGRKLKLILRKTANTFVSKYLKPNARKCSIEQVSGEEVISNEKR